MNLRDMHYLLAVAETSSFSEAATRCHVSQPTLSMQIRKLEETLGVVVFERTNKRVMLTEVGDRIVAVARGIVEGEEAIHTLARQARDPFAGTFRLGAIPTLAGYVFPAYVAAITKALPRLKLFLVEDKTETLLGKLREGTVDAALLALPSGADFLHEAPLFDDPFYLAMDKAHPLAGRARVTMQDLAGLRLLLLDDGHCLRDQALDVCHTGGATEQDGFRATSLETLRLMVAAPGNDFVTLLPGVALSRTDGLTAIPFAPPAPMRRIGLVWRKSTARTPLMERLTELLS